MQTDKATSNTAAQKAIMMVAHEFNRTGKLHGRFHSAHEGHGVIREEFDELWDEVKRKVHNKAKMREEAIQLAAMALHFIVDVCPPEVA